MGITRKEFGRTKDNEAVTLYSLSNHNGMTVSVIDYGANIVHILVPDKEGKLRDVNLGYDNITAYEQNLPGFGSFIGRYANRIAGAKVSVNGKEYSLEKNDGENCLHGGSKSYNKYRYDVETFEEEGAVSIELSRLSPHMEQGFPGNLDITVTYTLTEENELVIEYFAVSDEDTIVNLTNHSYFNLAGHDSGSILDHSVRIFADKYTKTDAALIPTGEFVDVAGTPLDFRELKRVGDEIDSDYEAIRFGNGYDHNFVLNNTTKETEKAAELWSEESGILMEVFTDLPGIQLYSANGLDTKPLGKDSAVYGKRAGICFESQFCPNACNMQGIPDGRIKADEEFESVTIYKFSIK